jgi:hypothetical protein
MVGAKGFEPSNSWPRNSTSRILKALSGVAYETMEADFPLSVVPKLYPHTDVSSRPITELKGSTFRMERPIGIEPTPEPWQGSSS